MSWLRWNLSLSFEFYLPNDHWIRDEKQDCHFFTVKHIQSTFTQICFNSETFTKVINIFNMQQFYGTFEQTNVFSSYVRHTWACYVAMWCHHVSSFSVFFWVNISADADALKYDLKCLKWLRQAVLVAIFTAHHNVKILVINHSNFIGALAWKK